MSFRLASLVARLHKPFASLNRHLPRLRNRIPLCGCTGNLRCNGFGDHQRRGGMGYGALACRPAGQTLYDEKPTCLSEPAPQESSVRGATPHRSSRLPPLRSGYDGANPFSAGSKRGAARFRPVPAGSNHDRRVGRGLNRELPLSDKRNRIHQVSVGVVPSHRLIWGEL